MEQYILQIYIYIHTHQYTYSNLKLYIPYRYGQIQNTAHEGGRTVLNVTPVQSSWLSEYQAEGFGGAKPGLVNPFSADNTSRSTPQGQQVPQVPRHERDATAGTQHWHRTWKGLHGVTPKRSSRARRTAREDGEGGPTEQGQPRGTAGGTLRQQQGPGEATRSGTLQPAHPTLTPDTQKL